MVASRRRRSSLLASLGAMIVLRTAAAAADEPEIVRFVYDAPVDCPAESTFLRRIADVGGAFSTDPVGEHSRKFTVRIEREDDFVGTLTVRDLLGEETVRSTSGASCEKVFEALAVFVAIALETLPTSPAPGAPADVGPEPLPPPIPMKTEPAANPARSGGIALTAFLGTDFAGESRGVRAFLATHVLGTTRLGVAVALSQDTFTKVSDTDGVSAGQGVSGRLGAVVNWGAPFARSVVGFVGEAGLRAGAGHGLVYPVTSPYGPVGRGELCFAGQDLLCSTSPGVPTSWSFASPYLAWSLVLQIPFKLSVRPFLEFTGLVSGNYAGDVTVTGAVEGGLAWQAW